MAAATSSPAAGESSPSTTTRHTTAIGSATAASSTITRRCSPITPATSAPSPSSAARLNTFEPITTPAPMRDWWPAAAVTAAVISGASAASAATIPSSASLKPSRAPRRSIRETSTQLAPRLIAALSTKSTASSASGIGAEGRHEDGVGG